MSHPLNFARGPYCRLVDAELSKAIEERDQARYQVKVLSDLLRAKDNRAADLGRDLVGARKALSESIALAAEKTALIADLTSERDRARADLDASRASAEYWHGKATGFTAVHGCSYCGAKVITCSDPGSVGSEDHPCLPAIREHVESCPSHPFGAMKAARDEALEIAAARERDCELLRRQRDDLREAREEALRTIESLRPGSGGDLPTDPGWICWWCDDVVGVCEDGGTCTPEAHPDCRAAANAHMDACPKHPIARLKADLAEAQGRADAYYRETFRLTTALREHRDAMREAVNLLSVPKVELRQSGSSKD